MKRLIAAVVLAVILLSLYFTSHFYITNTCKRTQEYLNECAQAYRANKNAYEKSEKINKFWNNREPLLSVFTSHSKIDDIEEALYCLKIYSKTNEKEIFYEYHGRVEILLHQLIEDTKPGMHSIL